MTITTELNDFITKEGNGNARDALNIALARLKEQTARANHLNARLNHAIDILEHVQNEDPLAWIHVLEFLKNI